MEDWVVVEEEEDVEKEEEVVVVEGGGACQAVSMVTSEVPPRSPSPSPPSPSPSSLQAPVRSLEGWAGPVLGAGRVGLRILSWRW